MMTTKSTAAAHETKTAVQELMTGHMIAAVQTLLIENPEAFAETFMRPSVPITASNSSIADKSLEHSRRVLQAMQEASAHAVCIHEGQLAKREESNSQTDETTMTLGKRKRENEQRRIPNEVPPSSPEAPALLSKADRAAVEKLQNDPTFSVFLQKLLKQSPAALGTLLHDHQVPLFSKDATMARSNLIGNMLQTVGHIRTLAAHHDAKEKERKKKSEKTIMFIGRDGLPDDLFHHVLGFLGTHDVASTALVCYDWAKACLSPNNACWQSVVLAKTIELADDRVISESCARERLPLVLKRPQFELVNEIGTEIDCMFDCNVEAESDLALLEEVASLCPNLTTLNQCVSSAAAAIMPELFPKLTETNSLHLDDPGEIVQYAQGMGDRLKCLKLTRSNRDGEPLGDDHLLAISKSCPNLEKILIDYHCVVLGISARGLIHLAKGCTKLKKLHVHIRFRESFDWEDVVASLSENPSLASLRIYDESDPSRANFEQVRQLVKKCFGDRYVSGNYDFAMNFILKSQGS